MAQTIEEIREEIARLRAEMEAISFAADQADIYHLDFANAIQASERRLALRRRIARLEKELEGVE